MVEKKFSDSVYRFTEPVRYFKANDPYYFEVDNIPIKQLEENCLWLRDQLVKTAETAAEAAGGAVLRADIDELKPYSTGTDRVVRVKPGRFSARINDVSSKDKLQYLIKALGSEIGDIDQLQFTGNNSGTFGGTDTTDSFNAKLQAALDKFRSTISSNALGMTGLEERAFTWPTFDEDSPINETGINTSVINKVDYKGTNDPSLSNIPALISEALLWAKTTVGSESFSLSLYDEDSGYSKLPQIESLLLKNWRGVTRFSIVDVPNELSIEVPAFDSDDFQTINDAGSEVDTAGVQTRIDMVFLYAKPVDSSGVKIVNSGNRLETITAPALGLVRGAGIKYSEAAISQLENLSPIDAFDSDGNAKILASPGDQNNSNMGFTATSNSDIIEDVRGSFPAPDDLLNIAPLLSEKLEEDALELVGQSILPVAYIFVKQNSETVLSTDVIDIRPFFRTAELTYNERAGIAAAVPQLSLANPAVGKAELQKEIYELKNNLTTKITQDINNTLATASEIFIPELMQLATPELIYKNPKGDGTLYDGFGGGDAHSPLETLYIRDEIINNEIASGKDANGTVDLSLVESVMLTFVLSKVGVADTASCDWYVYAGPKSNPIVPPNTVEGRLGNSLSNATEKDKTVFGDFRIVATMSDQVQDSKRGISDSTANSITLKLLYNQAVDPFEIGTAENYLSFRHFQKYDYGLYRFACFLDGYTIKRKISIT